MAGLVLITMVRKSLGSRFIGIVVIGVCRGLRFVAIEAHGWVAMAAGSRTHVV